MTSGTRAAGALGTGTRRQPGSGVGLPRPLVGSVLDAHGIEQFGITESTSESTDGSFTVTLSAEFVPPAHGSASSVGIPLLSLNAAINTTGGTIKGGQTLYYAISAVDGERRGDGAIVHRSGDDSQWDEHE